LTAVEAKAISAWESRKVWADDGSRSPGHRLARSTGLSVTDAKHLVHRARWLRSMPLCMRAFLDGELASSRVELLVMANQHELAAHYSRDEALLLMTAQLDEFCDAAKAIRYWIELADEERSESKAKRRHEARSASAAKSFEGTVDLRALFEPIGGEIFLNELERIEQEFFESDWADAKAIHGDSVAIAHLGRTPTQRRCDALVEMAKRSASARGGAPKPLLSVLVGQDSLKNLCELSSGTIILPGQLIPLLGKAEIERIVFDSPSRVIDVSHKRRFTGALRRAIEVRDRHCQHSSVCDIRADLCDVDHIKAWTRGGPTRQENGQLLCGKHNGIKGVGPP
jgi:hypothetical protein